MIHQKAWLVYPSKKERGGQRAAQINNRMLMFKIDPDAHRQYALEFKEKGMTGHSLELQRILRTMRREPLSRKHIVVTIEPNRRWMLAQLTGDKTNPLTFFPECVFDNLDDAEWEVFKRRWLALTGDDLKLLEAPE